MFYNMCTCEQIKPLHRSLEQICVELLSNMEMQWRGYPSFCLRVSAVCVATAAFLLSHISASLVVHLVAAVGLVDVRAASMLQAVTIPLVAYGFSQAALLIFQLQYRFSVHVESCRLITTLVVSCSLFLLQGRAIAFAWSLALLGCPLD